MRRDATGMACQQINLVVDLPFIHSFSEHPLLQSVNMASQGRRAQPQNEFAGFPMMSTLELVECLGALGIAVQVEDIAKPTAQSAQMLYAALLDQLMAAHLDLIERPKASLLDEMEYPVRSGSRTSGLN